MQTAEYDYEDFGQGQVAQSKADQSLLVRFYEHTRPCRNKPGEFETVDYIDIRKAGSRDCTVRAATGRDIERFPEHYARYKNRIGAPSEGTPLSEWAVVNRTLVERLSYLNIKTVEQLAAINDGNAPMEVRALGLKAKAAQWLDARVDDAAAAKLQEELALRDAQIEQLTKQVQSLAQQLNAET